MDFHPLTLKDLDKLVSLSPDQQMAELIRLNQLPEYDHQIDVVKALLHLGEWLVGSDSSRSAADSSRSASKPRKSSKSSLKFA